MFKANGTRHEFPLRKERTVVGRTNNCDLRIPLSSVSRQHCEISVADGKVKLRDLGSSNGTYHNSTRVTAATLKAGDEIVIGPVVFTVVIDGRPSKLEAKRTVLADDAGTPQSNSPTIVQSQQETAEAVSSAASALAQVMEDEEVPAAAADEDQKVTATADDDEPIQLEPLAPETPAAPAAESAGDDVLTLADDEPKAPAKAEAIEMDDDAIPAQVESEAYSPTTELDDPIAALGRMGAKRNDDEILIMPEDEDEDDKKKPKGR